MASRIELGLNKATEKSVYLDPDTRSMHMQVIGDSGSGKSKLLEHMIRQDIKKGHGLCLIDPHGTLYDRIVNWCAINGISRFRKIHLFQPTLEDWTFGFNPLEFGTQNRKDVDTCIDAVGDVFAQVWREDPSRTPLLKKCLRLTFFALKKKSLTLIEARDVTSVADVSGIRAYVTANLDDPTFEREWEDMNALDKRRFFETFGSTNNRIFEFVSSEVVKHIIGQQKNILDFRKIMDAGEIVLVDLSSRGLAFSERNSTLIGALLVNDLLLKAKSRPEGSRPFYLYIDECYRYLTRDIRSILFETRKFGLHLILAHHDLSELRDAGEAIYGAVKGGAQTKVVFRLGAEGDAEEYARQIFAGELDLEKPKKSFVSHQVVDHEKIWFQNWSQSETDTTTWVDSQGAGDHESTLYDPDDEELSTTHGSSSQASSQIGGSHSSSSSVGASEGLKPVIEKFYTTPYSLEELRYLGAAYIMNQQQRNAIFKPPAGKSKRILVPTVNDFPSNKRLEKLVTDFKEKAFQLSEFATQTEQVQEEISERQTRLLREANEPIELDEPESWKGTPIKRPDRLS